MNNIFPAVKAIIEENGKYLVIKQKIGDVEIWDFPGGKVEYGEDPLQALQREVAEEIGIAVKIIRPLGMFSFFTIKNADYVVCTAFLCAYEENSTIELGNNPADEQITDFLWADKSELLSKSFSSDSVNEFITECL